MSHPWQAARTFASSRKSPTTAGPAHHMVRSECNCGLEIPYTKPRVWQFQGSFCEFLKLKAQLKVKAEMVSTMQGRNISFAPILMPTGIGSGAGRTSYSTACHPLSTSNVPSLWTSWWEYLRAALGETGWSLLEHHGWMQCEHAWCPPLTNKASTSGDESHRGGCRSSHVLFSIVTSLHKFEGCDFTHNEAKYVPQVYYAICQIEKAVREPSMHRLQIF